MWYETIKQYYKEGLYTEAQLDTFVKAGMITNDQAQEIKASK